MKSWVSLWVFPFARRKGFISSPWNEGPYFLAHVVGCRMWNLMDLASRRQESIGIKGLALDALLDPGGARAKLLHVVSLIL